MRCPYDCAKHEFIPERRIVMDWKEHGVKIVHAGELDMNTPQTSGMTRAAAITHARTGAEKLWAGTMVVNRMRRRDRIITVN